MTIPDLRRALGVLVAESGEPPVDLLQRVAARRRRRNRRRATLAAAIAAVLGAGAVPVVRAVTAEPPSAFRPAPSARRPARRRRCSPRPGRAPS